ncbi:unnamed protein product, partial [marine sediment metagenome]
SSFEPPADIEINATITDNLSTITSVKAMINDTVPFNITMNLILGKWTCTWDNTSLYALGDYKITIWAIDSENNVNQTEFIIISLVDITNPSVTIDTPSDGSSFEPPANIEINATITDALSTITSVKAMINDTVPFNITMNLILGKWTCTWDNTSLYSLGDYKITIWAIDSENNVNQTEFVIISLIDITNPSVTIDTPSNGSSFEPPANIEINATITDALSTITSVKAMINATVPFNITMNLILGK